MRIAVVNDIANVGTVQARALRALGQEADLIEPLRPGVRLRYPWKAATLPFRLGGLLLAAARLRQADYDVVHVHYARLGLVGPLSGRPYVLHCHGSDIRGTTPGSAWGREVGPPLRAARLVYFATPDLEPWVRAFRRDAVFLPNPIETDRFRPEGRESAARRDLLVGVRLDPVKGLDTIVESVARLTAIRPGTSVTIVDQGRGVARAASAGGYDVRIVPRTTYAALPDLYRAHRVAIGQFLVGAIGNYELEAMASGLPVVANFRHTDAYAEPPPVVVAADAGSAAAALADLLNDEARRSAVATAGTSWIDRTHAAPTIAQRLVDDYQALLGRGATNRTQAAP